MLDDPFESNGQLIFLILLRFIMLLTYGINTAAYSTTSANFLVKVGIMKDDNAGGVEPKQNSGGVEFKLDEDLNSANTLNITFMSIAILSTVWNTIWQSLYYIT